MKLQVEHRNLGTGRVPASLMTLAALLLGLLAYALTSGIGGGGNLASDRLIVAECWNAIDRKDMQHGGREMLLEGCRRMERGFRRIYGSRP